jgi:hypothetical protein
MIHDLRIACALLLLLEIPDCAFTYLVICIMESTVGSPHVFGGRSGVGERQNAVKMVRWC